MSVEGKAAVSQAPAVRWIEVTEDEAGQRIDNYLIARLKGVPKSHVYRIIRGGEVRINSKRVQASQKIAAGERVPQPPVRAAARRDPEPAPPYRLPRLFEAEGNTAVHNPPGMAGDGARGAPPRADR